MWLPVTIAMVGKFLISMTFAIAYLYTAELFPTKVRNVAVGTASTFARIGSMSAPYIVDLLGGGNKVTMGFYCCNCFLYLTDALKNSTSMYRF